MKDHTVTVVIPTFGRPAALRRCLAALSAGRRQADAIMVADQSTDSRTREMLDDQFPRVVYRHLSPPNAAAARNMALHARTEAIAYTDDDCVPDPAWLEVLLGEYESGGRDVVAVTGRVLPFGRGLAVSSRDGVVRRCFRAADGGLDRGEWTPWDVGSGGNMLVRRATLAEVGGSDPRLGPGTPARAAEDIDLLYRLARAGTIVYAPKAVVFHAAQSRRARVRRRYAYGRGMGALLAKHLEARDPAARRLLDLYVRHQGANAWRGGPWGPPEALLTLAGAGRSLLPLLLPRRAPAEDMTHA